MLVLARPTAARAEALIRWETGGEPVSADWLRLAGLAAEFPGSKVARPRRPSDRELRALAVPALIVLAERSKAHDIGRGAARARERLPDARIEVLPGAAHHSIPARHAGDGHCARFVNRLLRYFRRTASRGYRRV